MESFERISTGIATYEHSYIARLYSDLKQILSLEKTANTTGIAIPCIDN